MELAITHKVSVHRRRAVDKVDRVTIKTNFAHLRECVSGASERCEGAHVLPPLSSGVARCFHPQDETKS